MKQIFLLAVFAMTPWVSPIQAAEADTKPLKVFLFAGQSNMVGRNSVVRDLSNPDLMKEQENLAFSQGAWLPVAPGNTMNIRPNIFNNGEAQLVMQGFGPEISFADRVSKELGEPVGIIKFAIGNSGLGLHWLPKSKSENFFNYLKQFVEAASKERKIEVVGMLWMQGERDALTMAQSSAYAANLNALIEKARADFDNADLIFIAGRIDMPQHDGDPAALEAVRHAIETVDLPNYAWVNTDDLQKIKDGIHIDTKGIEELGNRMADAFLDLFKKEE